MAFNPATLDTRAASDDGVWFDLTDVDGTVIEDGGKPVRLQLLGKDSAVGKAYLGEIASRGDTTATTATMIKAWSDNLKAKSVEELAEIPHIQDFVWRKVQSRANFTPKASKK